jgi:uridine kinase
MSTIDAADAAVVARCRSIAASIKDRPLMLAVDGVDGAGKSEYSARLLSRLIEAGADAQVVHIDDFHRLTADRYRRGRESPEGFWLDSYDYDAFTSFVLQPLLIHRTGRFTPVFSDLDSDRLVQHPQLEARPGSVLIVEGIFLHRHELAWAWDWSIFLEVTTEESLSRMARRDGTSADPHDPRVRRYVVGQALYLRQCHPAERANCVIENSDWRNPRVLRLD